MLTVQLTDKSLSWWFSVGILNRRVPLAAILSARVVAIPKWTGYGIWLDRHSEYWVLGGRTGLEMLRTAGPRLVVGVANAERFVATIQENRTR